MIGELKTWIKNRPFLLFVARLIKRVLLVNLILAVTRAIIHGAWLAYEIAWLYFYARRRIPKHLMAPDRPLIVMLVWSYLPADPRVEREARALASNSYRVRILCPSWSPDAAQSVPDWGVNVEIQLLPSDVKATLADFPWMLSDGLLKAALEESPWAYHAHDLNTAMTAMKAAAVQGALCVCDFHEWYSESVTFDDATEQYVPHAFLKRMICQLIEHLSLKRASRVITVCESIADELERMHRPAESVGVVRNIPPIEWASTRTPPTIDLREQLSIPKEKAILLYQGGIGPSRGLEPLIRAMANVRHAVLVIRGPGIEGVQKAYLDLAAKSGAVGLVHCVPAVPSARCVEEAVAGDLGFWTLLPICKNFTYALPNKVFEYLAAGLPLICAHHPEVKRIIDQYEVGCCFDPEDSKSIANAIDSIAGDRDYLRLCQSNIRRALSELRADKEWEKLVAIYDELRKVPSANLAVETKPKELKKSA